MAKKTYVLAGLFGLAAVMVIIGIASGDPGRVLTKAVTICLECVGLG